MNLEEGTISLIPRLLLCRKAGEEPGHEASNDEVNWGKGKGSKRKLEWRKED